MKSYLVDDKHFTIGSFNNDRWSFKLNNELNIAVYDDVRESQKIKEIVDRVKLESIKLQPDERVGPIRWVKIKFWEW